MEDKKEVGKTVQTRKELKQEAKQAAAEGRAARKEQKKLIAALPADERKAARRADRQARKAAKVTRKQQIKEMPKPERRQAKRHDRIFRKVRNRPRRAIGWGIVVFVVLLVGITVRPYASDIGNLMATSIDSDTPEGKSARENGFAVAEEISDEGIVLLKNEDNLLPLDGKVDGKGLNVFGFESFQMRYGGGGSGGSDSSQAVSLYEAMRQQGIEYNEVLYDFMGEQGATEEQSNSSGLMQIVDMVVGGSNEAEPEITYLSDEAVAQAKDYSDTALVLFGNDGVEMVDFSEEQLQLTANQAALLDKVTENFANVIVVINSGSAMELGFLDEYPQIKSALWIGTPGPRGAVSLAKILDGTVDPSGRLTDTYAYSVISAPATVNFGDYKYDNVDGRSFINYNEGIYIGYRFYETYYQDDQAAYSEAVQFPFGYGLSYTSFDWKTAEPALVGDEIVVEVEVTNTGKMAGKDVVEVYFSAPYTEGGLEKSAVELAGYAKTDLLKPGASQKVKVTFPLRDMSSYDMFDREAYVLEPGTYDIFVSTDVHTPVATYPYNVETEVVYDADEVTGTALENKFDYANGNLTYLSRADWAGTYPDNTNLSYSASDEVLAAISEEIPAGEGSLPTFEADNGIQLADLKGLDYDDPQWEAFLDQFSLRELKDMFVKGGYKTVEVERLGIPEAILLDGPAGINFFFGNVTAASYPTEVVIASTWNNELAQKMGQAIGKEANAYGVTGWYAPGMNLHRTAMGGRNFEYYSEDPLLSGKMGAAMVSGAQEQNVLVFMKHFVLNDQETNARSGINVWVNEQALRELYLRPFEITVKEGKASGAMSSFVHVGYKWAGGNPELLQDILRKEWGFDGLVSTDAVLGGFMDVNLAVRNGNDLMLDPLPTTNLRRISSLYNQDPVGIANGLRDRVHTTCYALLKTNLAS